MHQKPGPQGPEGAMTESACHTAAHLIAGQVCCLVLLHFACPLWSSGPSFFFTSRWHSDTSKERFANSVKMMTQDFKHCNDLKHTLLTLHNLIADSSRKCQLNRPSFIHAVPENCKAIEEATLAREKVGGKERDCKTQLSQFHCEEGADCMHNCRKPS